ncbi:VOC family protein [Kytococcus sedentarius]|uniref:Uncharacterized conserved protein n=1 Tax=Kytococcus sedentarius (strain ATCC 14392 / DSM 20547 / JCM 11482 / CCUG 33030 / NBRC 15357 / NCTC 11040 / CCM 314 / 541) TaxID=478801 RepID=C7NJ03_KYTSD|nr:VOC family protein [Kytococcus sedentarius]ACV05228.1 uncharacterized conserved protein [Kytococcus sedentarius DSM 20547]QQB63690.1 VOC family protein [Kytococcus sedentarius]STX13366.1 Predicted enzyme related to lactoylglutathione lyase [Kytococcus sedentarius]
MRFGYEVFHDDVRVPARFYVSVLGFTLDGPEGLTESTDYCTVTRDGLTVGCSRMVGAPTTPRKPPVGSEIVLRVEDVHREHDRVRAAGWPVEDPLQERPWGLTDFRVFDPTGQYLRITSSHGAASPSVA